MLSTENAVGMGLFDSGIEWLKEAVSMMKNNFEVSKSQVYMKNW